jgi:hypothetical protein
VGAHEVEHLAFLRSGATRSLQTIHHPFGLAEAATIQFASYIDGGHILATPDEIPQLLLLLFMIEVAQTGGSKIRLQVFGADLGLRRITTGEVARQLRLGGFERGQDCAH